MLVNQNMGNLSGIFNEANRLLSDSSNINSITKSQKIQPTQQENEEENFFVIVSLRAQYGDFNDDNGSRRCF